MTAPEPSLWRPPTANGLRSLDLGSARVEATEQRPLHILVPDAATRVRSSEVRCHVWSTPLPKGALYQLTDEVLLASPAFCLQQMAARTSVACAAAVGMEVCGAYARSPRANGGFYERPALDTVDGLTERFLREHGYGARRAREALAWVMPGSRSPMETVVALLLVLPVEEGGCELDKPVLNARIEIPASLRIALGKPYLVADLCWPEYGVILEYDSALWHGGFARVGADNARDEGLRDLGWMVRSVTADMLTNDAVLDELVRKVFVRAGKVPPEGAEYFRRRHALVRELLSA